MPRRTHTRAYYRLVIPPTTESTIVFPYQSYKNEFETSHYNLLMTDNRISLEEIKRFLHKVEKQLQISKTTSGIRFLQISFFVLCMIIIAVAIAVPLVIMHHEPGKTHDIPAIVVPAAFICFVLFFGLAIRTAIRMRNNLRGVGEKAKTMAKEHANVFDQRGFTWVVPAGFPSWLELWKDNTKQKGSDCPQIELQYGNTGISYQYTAGSEQG